MTAQTLRADALQEFQVTPYISLERLALAVKGNHMGQTTEQFAARRHIKPASVLARLSRTGSYFGIQPRKQANGRHDWPNDEPETGSSSGGTRGLSDLGTHHRLGPLWYEVQRRARARRD